MTTRTLVAYAHRDDAATCWAQSMYELLLYDRGRHIASVENVRCPTGDLATARNAMMKYMLEGGFEWLFMVDTDMGFQVGALEALHQAADPETRPIVGGLCFSQTWLVRDGRHGYRFEPKPTIYDWLEFPDGKHRFSVRHYYPVNGLVQCDGTGAAFVLIHRSIAEKVLNRFGPVWFDRTDDDDGLMSEDMSFNWRCHELGIPFWIHTGVRVTHQKNIWLGEPDFWERLPVPPHTEPVDVIVPVLHRPRNVKPFMQSLRATSGLATAWFVCEPGDREEMDAVREHGGRVIQHAGSFSEKVNYAYTRGGLKAPWVFLVGDDVMFHPAWLDHAQFIGREFDGKVVGTNDLGNPRVMRGDHATHLLIRRDYIDEVGASWDGPGVVCHEGYRHAYVDDEIVNAARDRHVFQMALGSCVEHMHPYWGKSDDDDVYAKGRESEEADKALLFERVRKYLNAEAVTVPLAGMVP